MKRKALLIFVLLLALSCKNKSEENNDLQTKFNHNSESEITGEIIFPDTVYLGQTYNGEIKYKSILDTFTTSFNDKEKDRYSLFYSVGSVLEQYEDNELRTMIKDTFGATDNHTIYFYDLQFKKEGINYIEGFLNDHIIINLNETDKNGDSLYILIENEIRLTKTVLVLPEVEKKLTDMRVEVDNGIKIRKKN